MSWLIMAEETTEELMKKLTSWAQSQFKEGDYATHAKEIEAEGTRYGMADEEIKIVIEDLVRTIARVTAAGQSLDDLIDNVPPEISRDPIVAAEYLAKLKDAALDRLEGGGVPRSAQDRYASMIGELSMAFQQTRELHQTSFALSAIERLKQLRREASVMDKSMIEDVFEQSVRQASVEGDQFTTYWGMAQVNTVNLVQANTGFTDTQATIRAAFLMGQCTAELWRKAVAEVKKECGPEIKKQMHGLTKWGTIRPPQAAAKDIVLKVLQSKNIYGYSDFVAELMHALGYNEWPTSEGDAKWKDFSPQRESSVQVKACKVGDTVTLPDGRQGKVVVADEKTAQVEVEGGEIVTTEQSILEPKAAPVVPAV